MGNPRKRSRSRSRSPGQKRKSRSKSKKKRRHSSSSSSSSSSTTDSSSYSPPKRKSVKEKKSHRKKKKHKHKHRSTSSSSSSSSRERKRHKKKKKKRKKKKKSEEKTIQKHVITAAPKEDSKIKQNDSKVSGGRSLKPMTKEEWEKQQSIVRRVYDPETGRNRLVKGDGEILEEIVSKDKHKEINKQSTLGDGLFFQSTMGILPK